MNFRVDAHLPQRPVRVLESRGHTAVHTLDLSHRNLTDNQR